MMKAWLGSPGTVRGLILRIGQCLLAASSIGVMASASGFSSITAFCYLIASMGLQFLWSFGLASLDIHALKFKRDLQSHILISLFVVGDWVTAFLSLAAACASAGVVVLFVRDTNTCKLRYKRLDSESTQYTSLASQCSRGGNVSKTGLK